MAGPELYAFNSADWEYEYSAMVRLHNPGETYSTPCPFYLVDHPEATVLIDTGVSAEMVATPEDYGPYGEPEAAFAAEDIEISEDRTAAAQLTDLGYAPADIDIVVMTHLHLDHAGNISEFPDAEFVVQQAELEYAWWPADPMQRRLYLQGDFGMLRTPAFEVREVEGWHDVLGDGTIECIPTPGHTPGHQAVSVELDEAGTVILGADLAFLESAYENDLQPSFAADTEQAIRSAREIRNLARAVDATVFLAHDRDHLDSIPTPPESLT